MSFRRYTYNQAEVGKTYAALAKYGGLAHNTSNFAALLLQCPC